MSRSEFLGSANKSSKRKYLRESFFYQKQKGEKYMKKRQQQYLSKVRANSSYPTYRGIIGVMTILGYLMGLLYGLGICITGVTMLSKSGLTGCGMILFGTMVGAIMILGARFFKEGSLILVDIGDSLIEKNAGPTEG